MKKWKRWGANLLVNIPIMLLSLTCIFPVVWLLYSSLKTDVEFARSPISLPAVPNFGNYVTAFQRASFGTFTFNSVFNSIISLMLVLVISFTLGYLLSRYRFRGRNLIYGVLMAAMMVPHSATWFRIAPLKMISSSTAFSMSSDRASSV